MSELIVETTAEDLPHGFRFPTQGLLNFLSFAAAERYGSTHPLSVLAQRVRREGRIDTRPFWEFDDAEPEDEQDRANLERLWQEPGPLAEAAAATARALRDDPALAALADDAPHLADLLDDLATIARWAAQRGARVRLTYRL